MTAPYGGAGNEQTVSLEEPPAAEPGPEILQTSPYPPAMLELTPEKMDELKIFMDRWLQDLIAMQSSKLDEFAGYEALYRARGAKKKSFPFEGACADEVPAIAMAVDPIFARLDTGIFKQDRVFRLKALKKFMLPYIDPLERWVDFYIKHYAELRKISQPRMLECVKLGTMVFKTVYDRDETPIVRYNDQLEPVKTTEVRYRGPRAFGISLDNFLFPPLSEDLQPCVFVAERQRVQYSALKIAEAQGKLVNCSQIRGHETWERTVLEDQRESAAKHQSITSRGGDELIVYECWFEWDVDGDGIPEKLVATYHLPTRTLLQLRYNWYYHQRKPYVLIPYSVTSASLYGIGIAEMVAPFQDALTRWHQMAADNAYIANIRMFIVKHGAPGIEEVPRLYPGRCFFVDDPKNDFIPFQAGETYPSTLQERQNIMGMIEKRTGVSDYLTGRESPIVGSRATATSTVALIQEGTKRVEQVLENLRYGYSEILMNFFYIWAQYGLDGLDDLVFGDDEIGAKVHEFFTVVVSQHNINGAIAIDLAVNDAGSNRQAQQQMQLSIIQVMMGYYDKLMQAAATAIQAAQQVPPLSQAIVDTMEASRQLFRDLLTKYDIPNPEDYLPDLRVYINAAAASAPPPGQGAPGDNQGAAPGPEGNGGMGNGQAPSSGPSGPRPSTPGSGGARGGPDILSLLAGGNKR